jgi:hypothetical protein
VLLLLLLLLLLLYLLLDEIIDILIALVTPIADLQCGHKNVPGAYRSKGRWRIQAGGYAFRKWRTGNREPDRGRQQGTGDRAGAMAPASFAGSLKIMSRDRIELLDSNLGDTSRVLSHWGVGDLLLISSLLELGGDFWDKIRGLFIMMRLYGYADRETVFD